MTTTISSFTSPRTGKTSWPVSWGPGMTQERVCLSLSEAEACARGESPESADMLAFWPEPSGLS